LLLFVKFEILFIVTSVIYKDTSQEYRKNKFDIYFLSVELFLYYLEFDKQIDEILEDIRQVSFSTGDLYFEYLELLKIKNYKNDKIS